ncbi:MAG: tetratricopeptide repeat protein, partial [Spirochaetota bacterium]
YLRGVALYRLGQYPKAVRSLREYIDGNGQNLRVFYALGLSYRQLQRGAEAMESFGEALAKGLKHAATYWELAKLKLEQQDAKKALEYVDEALSLKEGDGRYLQTKGSALFHLKRYREAADMFRQADGAGVEPSERGLVNYNMGLSYLNSAQYPQAEKAFLQAIRLDGSKPEYVLGLADSQIAAGKSEEARKHLASAVKKFPDNAELLLIQGNIFFKAKEYEAALEVFRKAYRQNPKDRKVINNLGLAYMNTEQFEQSRSFFRKAIVEDPINSDLWFNLALVDVATEQHEGAIAALEKTLSLDASDGKKSDAYYLLCKEYFAAGRADEARETLVRLRRANPKDAKIVELEKLLAE